MVIKCSVCKKMKKFQKWIPVPRSIKEELKDVKVLYVICDDCRKEVSIKKNSLNNSEHRLVCI